MEIHEYEGADATALADLVRRREVTPLELTQLAIRQIEGLDPGLGAVVHSMADEAKLAASASDLPDGPLRGVPFLVKDLLLQIPGHPLTGSCRLLREYVPKVESTLAARYRKAGLVVIGKTNTPEFGILGITEPAMRGPTKNPWDPSRGPGGSSGGSAAAVAARMVPAAHGGDGGGSIRIPSSHCGLFGLKPTRGRTPSGPGQPQGWSGMVCQHVLTRSVRDSALLLDVAAGSEPGALNAAPPQARPFVDELSETPKTLRIGVFEGALFGKTLDEGCTAAVQSAAALCEELGHEVQHAKPDVDLDALVYTYLTLVAANVAVDVAEAEARMGRRAAAGDLEPTTQLLRDIGRSISAAEFVQRKGEMAKAAHAMATFHERYDILLLATTGHIAPKIGQYSPNMGERLLLTGLRRFPAKPLLRRALDEMATRQLAALPNTQLFNITGQPAMSVPLHWTDEGLPVGAQFVAPFGDEATLFRLAAQLEQARPWKDRRPPR